MKITHVEFVKSVASLDQLPKDRLAEIAFAGRSNVGKSSLINCLLNRRKLAKTSSTPGKTRLLNYFRINNKFYFVDLPGYGFAKVSKSEREQWQNLIDAFITRSENLRAVVSITDGKVGPTVLDMQLLDWLKTLHVPVLSVATKVDKLPRSKILKQMQQIKSRIGQFSDFEIIPFSSVTGAGKRELLTHISKLVD